MSIVLGIIGATLPPLASHSAIKHARDSLYNALAKCIFHIEVEQKQDIDYALVTMDRETGPWICNLLRKRKIPYITVETEDQPLTNKLRYWQNQAIDRISVPFDMSYVPSAIYDMAQAPFTNGLVQKSNIANAAKKRCSYLLRNQWTINRADHIFLCCLPPVETKNWTSIRSYFREQLEALSVNDLKDVTFWADRPVALLLHDSHTTRKIHQKKAKRKQAMKKKFATLNDTNLQKTKAILWGQSLMGPIVSEKT